GWHCDGVIRDDKNSQPNLDTLNEPISHFVLTGCSAPGACPTEYWNPTIELEFTDEEKNHVWKSLDTKIKELDNSEEGNITKSVDWAMYHMYRDTPHRGTQATKRTWRMFYRMSFYHMPCANQFRNQVVVY